jgi:hypothetical protein
LTQEDSMADDEEQAALREAEIEAVWADAEEAANQTWQPGGWKPCPHPEDDWRAEVWKQAYGHHLARNGWH